MRPPARSGSVHREYHLQSMEKLTRERDALRLRLAGVEMERDAAFATIDRDTIRLDMMTRDLDALRLRLAEVERERDEACGETAKAWREVDCGGEEGCEILGPQPCRAHAIDILARTRMEVAALRMEHAFLADERDDARRVAKRLARNIYSPRLPTMIADIAAAIAYEVEP